MVNSNNFKAGRGKSMSEMKFKIGSSVYHLSMIFPVPGVIHNAKQDEYEEWFYDIKQVNTVIIEDVPEKLIIVRTIVDPPKYKCRDQVEFIVFNAKNQVGTIEIVDAYGTFEQNEEPSYDIKVKGNPGCMYKHIKESEVIGLA